VSSEIAGEGTNIAEKEVAHWLELVTSEVTLQSPTAFRTKEEIKRVEKEEVSFLSTQYWQPPHHIER